MRSGHTQLDDCNDGDDRNGNSESRSGSAMRFRWPVINRSYPGFVLVGYKVLDIL